MNYESQEHYDYCQGAEAEAEMEQQAYAAQAEFEAQENNFKNVVHEQIEKAQDVLSALCKNPSSFTMRVPADEEKDTDLIIAKALRYANQMQIALDKIVNAPIPYNERELQSWMETAREISYRALNGQNDIVEPVKSLDKMDF